MSHLGRVCLDPNPAKNGQWNDPTTWDTGTVPSDWDVVIIPAAYKVEVSGVNGTTYANISITVNGELNMDNGQKLKIDCNSLTDIRASGTLSGDNGGSKLWVCDGYKYSGPSPVYGPASYGRTPLPLELVSFTAEVKDGQFIELEWVTASETNNDFFTIEKSTNGISYDAITTEQGAGNSTTQLSYSYSCDIHFSCSS